jgi:predicted transcriptional regulator of viral defense system
MVRLVSHARTGGVVTTSDLRTCGFSEPAILSALRRGLLRRWGKGVYLVGPLTDDLTEARAAVAALPHGALGFEVAGQLAEFSAIAKPPIDVIVAPGKHAGRSGVRVHRIDLARRDVTRLASPSRSTATAPTAHRGRTTAITARSSTSRPTAWPRGASRRCRRSTSPRS